MSLTSTSVTASHPGQPAAVTGTCPDGLVHAVRAEVRRGLGWQHTADCVARALRASLPDPAAILPASLRRGDPAGYQSHLLYAEPDGTFSISAMVWLPGQQTMIHDHVAWCVTGVLQGREYEEIFALADGGRALRLAASKIHGVIALLRVVTPRIRGVTAHDHGRRRVGAAGQGSCRRTGLVPPPQSTRPGRSEKKILNSELAMSLSSIYR